MADTCPRWCEEAAGHELPHRAYVGELTLAPPQPAHHVAVALIGPDGRAPVGVELTTGAARAAYCTALLDWSQVDQLAGMLHDARKRYAS